MGVAVGMLVGVLVFVTVGEEEGVLLDEGVDVGLLVWLGALGEDVTVTLEEELIAKRVSLHPAKNKNTNSSEARVKNLVDRSIIYF